MEKNSELEKKQREIENKNKILQMELELRNNTMISPRREVNVRAKLETFTCLWLNGSAEQFQLHYRKKVIPKSLNSLEMKYAAL
ncbi:hypothetical protein JTB14_002294 [Gonioctena quinquepunctata]|nr:hypothetical protein JTB14_002294 [Gonioctena quinquepunctata]